MGGLFHAGIGQSHGIKSRIDATDKKIDRMVYELYGFVEKKVRMVEE